MLRKSGLPGVSQRDLVTEVRFYLLAQAKFCSKEAASFFSLEELRSRFRLSVSWPRRGMYSGSAALGAVG